MAGKKFISIGNQTQSSDIYSAPVHPSVSDGLLVEGTFVSISSGGQLILADNRNAQGKPRAVGALLQSHQLKDFRGNTVDTVDQMSYARQGKIGNLTGLTPGATYYLSSGGGMTINSPASAGDVRQEVGYAESATVLVLMLGPAHVI